MTDTPKDKDTLREKIALALLNASDDTRKWHHQHLRDYWLNLADAILALPLAPGGDGREDTKWQDAMRERQHAPIQSDYSTMGRGGAPVPTLSRILTALYAAEVDFNIASAWDSGLRVAVHKPCSEGWTDRGFTVGKAPHDFPTWLTMWEAVVFFICETVIRDWENLEDRAPVDIGCLDCTANTTPTKLATGLCVYHIAKHVMSVHGLEPTP